MKKPIRKRIAAATLSIALVIGAIPCSLPAQAAGNRFTDVPNNAWYKSAVTYATENNLFSGNGDGTFDPNGSMTRGMFVTVLSKVAGANVSSAPDAGFQDVPNAWYTDFVNWAYNKGYVAGTSATTFEPNTAITRQQIAVILRNYIQKENITLSPAANGVSSFKDMGKVASWARTAVDTIRSLGLMSGDEEGNFNPTQRLTRAEAASVFMKFDMKLKGIPESSPDLEEEIRDALTAHPWDLSIQTRDCYQFFEDGTGVNLYSVPIPQVIPFTYIIDEATSTVTLSCDLAWKYFPVLTYSADTNSFTIPVSDFPNPDTYPYTIHSGNIQDEFTEAAESCETDWEQTVQSTAASATLGNCVKTMQSLRESIYEYLSYVLSQNELSRLDSQLAAWEQERIAEMDSIQGTGSIVSLSKISVNKDWTMKEIYEMIKMIP